ncbi:hypothetical protein K469DRAFT_711520 [Zopfia rhizophila CBS 207.26]|uniref:Prokaryotic-type class I peptide chain release factors domain-containing protein n=1 Tax=Zopfia rhizophila CBS 207.26 TaxID=1314779 RepID=A0A6A6DXA5_9PEZI|nr:hypothetical protein K469DRAFT_711520 [Zopfia rhizophila CBS 207.26]
MPLSTILRLAPLRPTPSAILCNSILVLRPFTSTCVSLAKQLPPRRAILNSEIEENFLKGSGPGGQKINKTSSAVQLKHLPTGIVVKCQETRSRSQNRKIARKILGERIEELELGEASRTAVKAREKSRKKASSDKKRRRKYRALAEAKEGQAEDVAEEVDSTEHERHTTREVTESAGKVG